MMFVVEAKDGFHVAANFFPCGRVMTYHSPRNSAHHGTQICMNSPRFTQHQVIVYRMLHREYNFPFRYMIMIELFPILSAKIHITCRFPQ